MHAMRFLQALIHIFADLFDYCSKDMSISIYTMNDTHPQQESLKQNGGKEKYVILSSNIFLVEYFSYFLHYLLK